MRSFSSILGLALFALTLSLPAADPALQVAFIGNSFTDYEDLPGKFRNLAIAAGKTAPVTGESIYLGHSLENQWVEKNAQVTGLIKSKPWTHIVLQDHSTQTYARTATFEKYAKIYHDYIRANCPNPNVKIVWFLTWARFDSALQTNPQYIYGNALELDKQHIIASAYQKMRNLYGDILVPAGVGLDVFRQRNNWAWSMKLTRSDTDMNHVRPEGTYLAACTFFGVLYGQSPVGLPLSSDLTMGATVGRGLERDRISGWFSSIAAMRV